MIPITVRNYVIFDAFVPVSINGGLTLWQGTVDAGGDAAGAKRHDTLVAEEESIRYGKPRYADWWAEPDGIWRDHDRYRRAVEVVRANPARYARVMLGRMGEMLNYAAGEAPAVLRAAPPLPREGTRGTLREGEDGWLAPGRAAEPLRAPLAWLQPALSWVLLPLVVLGAALARLARLAARRDPAQHLRATTC